MSNMVENMGNFVRAFAFVFSLSWGIGGSPLAAEEDPRSAKFPNVTMEIVNSAPPNGNAVNSVLESHAIEVPTNSNDVDFYNRFIKGRTVIINFFYTKCDGKLCDRGTRNLVQVQNALGDRLGQEVFIYSITLDPEHDTPEMLKAYAEAYGAKPGWSFLRGDAEEIADLREKLGLSPPDPELSRILNPVSAKVAAAGKLIEARAPMQWEPKVISALLGDVLEWKMGADTPGEHGVRITNWAAVKDHVEVESVVEQQPFNTTTGQNDTSTSTAGKVLLRLKFKSDPLAPVRMTYECIEHGRLMTGQVSIGQQHSAMIYIYNDPADRNDTIPILAAPSQILEAIERIKPRQHP